MLLPPAPAHCSVPETKPAVQGEVKQYDSYHKRSKVLYDDLLEEWLALPRAKFQCLLPRARCALLCSALLFSTLPCSVVAAPALVMITTVTGNRH